MDSVHCSSKSLEIYEAIRKNKKYRYIVFRIVSDKVIDAETVGPRDNDYQQFVADLVRNGTNECRYGLFDLEYVHVCEVTKQPQKRERLVLLSWCPTAAKPKGKMQYLSYLQPFMKELKGVQYYKTVPDMFELSRERVENYFHWASEEELARNGLKWDFFRFLFSLFIFHNVLKGSLNKMHEWNIVAYLFMFLWAAVLKKSVSL